MDLVGWVVRTTDPCTVKVVERPVTTGRTRHLGTRRDLTKVTKELGPESIEIATQTWSVSDRTKKI